VRERIEIRAACRRVGHAESISQVGRFAGTGFADRGGIGVLTTGV